ncbi:TPA: hypothetical protein ACH3X1_014555 [Trebouxia sp. C0004]
MQLWEDESAWATLVEKCEQPVAATIGMLPRGLLGKLLPTFPHTSRRSYSSQQAMDIPRQSWSSSVMTAQGRFVNSVGRGRHCLLAKASDRRASISWLIAGVDQSVLSSVAFGTPLCSSNLPFVRRKSF